MRKNFKENGFEVQRVQRVLKVQRVLRGRRISIGFAAFLYEAMHEGRGNAALSFRQPSPRGEGTRRADRALAVCKPLLEIGARFAQVCGKRLPAHDKDFSASLEMTIRESDVF